MDLMMIGLGILIAIILIGVAGRILFEVVSFGFNPIVAITVIILIGAYIVSLGK